MPERGRRATLLAIGAMAVGATLGTSSAPLVRPVLAEGPRVAPVASADDPLVEAALASLTSDRALVGQLLLLTWDGRTPRSADRTLARLRPGGLVFLANATRWRAARRISRAIAERARELGMVPPFRAIDHEGGRVQRIVDLPNLGSNAAFGASDPTRRDACERGATHARDLRAMDIDMDLAPVLDVASDPRNTVIGDRSYGPDPRAVARLGGAYIRGLQAGGVIATGKHFPGHGDTRVDSHLALPVLPFGRRRLDAVELVPFRRAIAPRVDAAAIMVGHLALPKLDPTGSPATLSAPIVTGLLRDDLGYDGLVITDDLGAMAAITSRYPPGVAAVRAIRAGVDMLIIVRSGRNQVRARDALLRALASGRLDRERVVASVRRILMVKARFGLLDGVRPAPVACDALPGADRAGGADATG